VLEERLRFASPARWVAAERARIADAMPRLEASIAHRAELARERTARLSQALSSLSPLAVLQRGYAVVWKHDEARPLRSSAEAAAGDRLRIQLANGKLHARVVSSDGEDA